MIGRTVGHYLVHERVERWLAGWSAGILPAGLSEVAS